ncbi:hypothetical protein [Paenibacillus amylolyticus]
MIHLKRVSVDNWYACTQLDVTEEQRKSFPRQLYIGLLRLWKRSVEEVD